VRHAFGVDAELSLDPVGDELTALDEAANRPGGHAENGGHLNNRKKMRETNTASVGPSTFVIPRRGRSLLAGRRRGELWLALLDEGVPVHLAHRPRDRSAPDLSTPSARGWTRASRARRAVGPCASNAMATFLLASLSAA
jgi:hypothetical protein